MRGKKAKIIRKRASDLLTAMGVGWGEGHGEYKYLPNRTSWEPASMPDGSIMTDQDGVRLLRPVKVEGTRIMQWKHRVFYKWLKKLYKANDPEAQKILNMSEEELVENFKQPE
jgi:hypothetical protein